MGGVELVVAADDRSGAIETAGALADVGAGAVPVVTSSGDLEGGRGSTAGVIDLGSRRVTPEKAAALAVGVDRRVGHIGRHAHKIDSTLRGNWAHELVARHGVTDRRILVVPALPSLGRSCAGGVVLHHGRPVHEGPSAADIGRRTNSSRPDQHLRGAGAGSVVSLADSVAVDLWLASSHPFAVCDAADDDDLHDIATRWAAAHPVVVLAGTSAAIAAAGRALLGGRALAGDTPTIAVPEILPPVVVVCGSLHAAARAQLARLEEVRRGRPDIAVVATDVIDAPPEGIAPLDAAAAASRLARSAHEAVRLTGAATVVLIGGDTAAAHLGDAPVAVGGTVAPGTSWGRHRADGPLLIVRSGGFGGPNALVDLLSGTLTS